jgi:hypothetical protein
MTFLSRHYPFEWYLKYVSLLYKLKGIWSPVFRQVDWVFKIMVSLIYKAR